MKTLQILLPVALAAVTCGCVEPAADSAAADGIDAWLVNAYADEGVRNAVVAQHTLYPYHFVADGEALNDLGRHDLNILARHFRDNAGVLNISSGEAAAALFAGRVQTVQDALKEAGVEPDRIAIADGPPGGEGLSARRVLTVLGKLDASKDSSKSTQTTSYAPTPMDTPPSGGTR